MQKNSDLTREVERILATLRPEADYSGSDDFIADGLLDSFDIVTLVADLDAAFGISISGIEITPENFSNSKHIAELVERHRKAV